jgi:hypothetical protein
MCTGRNCERDSTAIPMSFRHVEPLVSEIFGRIVSGSEDQRLKWGRDRLSVRVLVPKFIAGLYQQTQSGRRHETNPLLVRSDAPPHHASSR